MALNYGSAEAPIFHVDRTDFTAELIGGINVDVRNQPCDVYGLIPSVRRALPREPGDIPALDIDLVGPHCVTWVVEGDQILFINSTRTAHRNRPPRDVISLSEQGRGAFDRVLEVESPVGRQERLAPFVLRFNGVIVPVGSRSLPERTLASDDAIKYHTAQKLVLVAERVRAILRGGSNLVA